MHAVKKAQINQYFNDWKWLDITEVERVPCIVYAVEAKHQSNDKYKQFKHEK